MAQGYYTLTEAAEILQISEDELKMIARGGEVRSFQDRGTWRFRVQDIQELARQRGMGSDPDLILGEGGEPIPQMPTGDQGSVFDEDAADKQDDSFSFSLEASSDSFTDVGREKLGSGSSSGSKSSKRSGSKQKIESAGPDSKGPRTPEPGADSDVRLVQADDSDFNVGVDSDPRLAEPLRPTKVAKSKPDSSKKKLAPADTTAPDSGVRLVPMDSDSDVRIVGDDKTSSAAHPPLSSSRDSDVRMEKDADELAPDSEAGSLTEEIDLDEEQRRWEEQQIRKREEAGGSPDSSPFELSDSDMELPPVRSSLDDTGSSELDLESEGDSSSPLDLGSSDFELNLDDSAEKDIVGPAPVPTQLAAPISGIGIDNPIDSGISLEQDSEGSDEIDFNLEVQSTSLDPSESAMVEDDSSSEFELTLDTDDSSAEEMSALSGDSSSDFELLPESDSSSVVSSAESDSSGDFDISIEHDSADDFSVADSSSPQESALADDSSSELEVSPSSSGRHDTALGDASLASDSSSEFELTLDADDSSGEFSLSIEEEGDGADLTADSEFNVGFDEEASDSSSEFDLTIDDDISLVAEDSTTGTLNLGEEPELLETPLIEEDESGSEVIALEEDTDLESSDFDIALDDSSSQVVTLDEEEDFDQVVVEEDDGEDLSLGTDFEQPGFDEFIDGGQPGVLLDEEEEEEEPEPLVIQETAPWGALPIVVMLPCVAVMLVVGIMCFELLQSMNGYEEPGVVTKAIGGLIDPEFGKTK